MGTETFKTSFCAKHRCSPDAFNRRILWRTLPLPILPLAIVYTWVARSAFNQDIRLIEFCGEAANLPQIRDEIAGYFSEARYWSPWRRRLHCRISTHKLKRLARQHFPSAASEPAEALSDYLATI